jgi:hypothetical protein
MRSRGALDGMERHGVRCPDSVGNPRHWQADDGRCSRRGLKVRCPRQSGRLSLQHAHGGSVREPPDSSLALAGRGFRGRNRVPDLTATQASPAALHGTRATGTTAAFASRLFGNDPARLPRRPSGPFSENPFRSTGPALVNTTANGKTDPGSPSTYRCAEIHSLSAP